MENKKKDFKKRDFGKGGFQKIQSFQRKQSFQNEDRFEGSEAEDNGIVVGRNAVRELLKSNRAVDKIYVKKGGSHEGSITVLISEAVSCGIPIVEVEGQKLDFLASGANHQGIVAQAAMKEYSTVDDMIALAEERGEKPLIVIADSIEDPHNLGAIIRTADAAGAHGVIIPKRRNATLSYVVGKTSAGAVEHVPVARVANLPSTLDELKERGVWVYGADMDGQSWCETDFSGGVALVIGSEGRGLGRLVKEKCDFVVSIPLYGQVNSMNVSCAAAILLAEVARQRNNK